MFTIIAPIARIANVLFNLSTNCSEPIRILNEANTIPLKNKKIKLLG